LDTALNIVSDNPRSHVGSKAKRRASTSRIQPSSSAPFLRRHTISMGTKPPDRWGVGSASSQNARLGSRNVKSSVSNGLGGMKQPTTRPSLGGQSNNNDQGSNNASWGEPSLSQLHGLGSDNNRLRNLGLAGFNAKKPEGKRGALGVPTPRPCRWTIPKTSSDSSFVHPTRHRDS
jgi:hypothetical protein